MMDIEQRNIILIGGGGHCKSSIDVIESEGRFKIAGVLDQSKEIGSKISDYEILGGDDKIAHYNDMGYFFLVTVGQIKNSVARKKIFNYLKAIDANIATILSPYSYISPRSSIGEGSIVMHGAKINSGAVIGHNCIINTGSIIEHDVVIGAFSHISTQAVINGDCIIGEEVFIGSNSTVSSQVNISGNIIVGAGCVVIKELTDKGVYVGNPAKKISE